MSHQAFIEYIKAMQRIYWGVTGKTAKSKLIDDAVALTGRHRKTVIRYMARKRLEQELATGRPDGRGRPVEYLPEELLPVVRVLWRRMERPGAPRMKAVMEEWLSHYRGEPALSELVRLQLMAMSAGTLNRLLAQLRGEEKARKGLSTTTSGIRAVKNRVPINTLDQVATRPGFTQADTVAHCGSTTAGQYLNSLTITDLWSTWTEVRALPTKTALDVRRAFVEMKKALPFELLAVNTDSGSEFINTPMIEFLSTPYGGKAITFTRSRPYKKNDNAYVEQKNYTHVRQLFGYYRLEDHSLVTLMNEIYRDCWCPLQNFFLPTQKLIEKTRVGAKVVKKHDKPKTPYQRLMESEHLSGAEKEALQARRQSLNPFDLSDALEAKLKLFFTLYRQSQEPKKEAA
jgi:hypothetical protein